MLREFLRQFMLLHMMDEYRLSVVLICLPCSTLLCRCRRRRTGGLGASGPPQAALVARLGADGPSLCVLSPQGAVKNVI